MSDEKYETDWTVMLAQLVQVNSHILVLQFLLVTMKQIRE
jgi:hypothetical protein